ncbi:MAG: DNA polymerase III subunit delta, partial [Gammaproteobacteria bacterium]|nr:DNA polymerase III subunit delta [Gammaproteobacteria bacterium]
MKIYANQVAGHLQRGLAPVYLIAGDEILLQQEAVDTIRSKARAEGFTERELYIAERGFDWGQLLSHAGNFSLFASRKIVELRLPTGKVHKEGMDLMDELISKQPEDILLIILCPKLERGVTSSKWYKSLDQHGVFVDVRPVRPEHMQRWISERLGKHGLRAETDAVRLLVDRIEGNLLAAAQEIDKIALLFSDGDLTVQQVQKAVAHSARYDVYRLSDAALSGWKRRALKILDGLQSEGVEPILLMWSLLRDLHQLIAAAHGVQAGKNQNSAMRSVGIWDNRSAAFGHALNSHSVAALYALIDHASDIDRIMKGQLPRKTRSGD